MWGFRTFDDLAHDMRYGARYLGRSPMFTLVAVVSVAVAIGAGAAIFAITNAVAFRPIGVGDGETLYRVFTGGRTGGLYGSSSYLDYQAFADAGDIFSATCATDNVSATLAVAGDAVLHPGEIVSPDCFDALRLKPAFGRFFNTASLAQTSSPIVVSHGLWTRRLAADPAVIGQTVVVNGKHATIVAVAPRGFTGTSLDGSAEFWAPIGFADVVMPPGTIENRHRRFSDLRASARRHRSSACRSGAPGDRLTAPPRGRARLENRRRRHPPRDRYAGARRPFRAGTRHVPPDARPRSGGCRAHRRHRVREPCDDAAGAGCRAGARTLDPARTGRLTRACPPSAGDRKPHGVVGRQPPRRRCGRRRAAVTADYRPQGMPAFDVALDWRVLLFSVATAVGASLLFGLAPAAHALKLAIAEGMKAPSAVRRIRRLRVGPREALIVLQVTASLALLLVSTLFVQASMSAGTLNPGFNGQGVVILRVGFESLDRRRGAWRHSATAGLRPARAGHRAAYRSRQMVPLAGERMGFSRRSTTGSRGITSATSCRQVTSRHCEFRSSRAATSRCEMAPTPHVSPSSARPSRARRGRQWRTLSAA